MQDIVKDRYRFVIEAMVLSVLISIGLIWVAPGPLLPLIMGEYGVDRGTVSWSMSVVALVMAIFAMPAGIIATKIGIKRTFAIGAFLLAGGLATPLASNFGLFLATRLIFAIGAAMTFPVAGGIIVQWFRGRELPLINGFNLSAASIGSAIALYVSVPIATTFVWKLPPSIYALIAFLFALAWLVLGKERLKSLKGETEAATDGPSITIGTVLKQRTTLLLGGSMVGPFALSMAIATWLPAYYNEVFQIPLAKASAITALFTIFGIPASILGGFLPMRIGLRKPFLVVPGLLIGFAGLGTFMIDNSLVIFSAVALFGVCFGIFMPSLFTLAMELPNMTPPLVPLVLAVALTAGNLGGFLGPLIVGYSTDLTGSYLVGLTLCSVLSWSLFICGLLLPETGPKAKRKA